MIDSGSSQNQSIENIPKEKLNSKIFSNSILINNVPAEHNIKKKKEKSNDN
jgi:hypothetical protein